MCATRPWCYNTRWLRASQIATLFCIELDIQIQHFRVPMRPFQTQDENRSGNTRAEWIRYLQICSETLHAGHCGYSVCTATQHFASTIILDLDTARVRCLIRYITVLMQNIFIHQRHAQGFLDLTYLLNNRICPTEGRNRVNASHTPNVQSLTTSSLQGFINRSNSTAPLDPVSSTQCKYLEYPEIQPRTHAMNCFIQRPSLKHLKDDHSICGPRKTLNKRTDGVLSRIHLD